MKLFGLLTFTIILLAGKCFSQAEVRMIAHDLHQGQLLVELQIRSTESTFMLSNHNIRIYYNSEEATLSAFYGALPTDSYGEIVITDVVQNTDGSIVNELPYDRDMGFINLSTIHNSSYGTGIEVSNEWIKIGSLVFQGSGDIKALEATWARKVVTGRYATAFVEVTEWKNNITEKIEISKFYDLTWQQINFEKIAPMVSIGPNPSADYIIVNHHWEGDVLYELYNIQGLVLQSGSILHTGQKIDLSVYNSGTYIVRLNVEGVSYNQLVEKVDLN